MTGETCDRTKGQIILIFQFLSFFQDKAAKRIQHKEQLSGMVMKPSTACPACP